MKKEESFGIIPLKNTGNEWNILIILHKRGNHWGFPKGNADAGESSLQSATRELLEETGLQVEKVLVKNPIVETYTFFRGKDKIFKTVHYFPAIVSGVLLLQPEEIQDGRWLTFAQAEETLTFSEAKTLCKRTEGLAEIQ